MDLKQSEILYSISKKTMKNVCFHPHPSIGLKDGVKHMEKVQKAQQVLTQEAYTIIRKLIHPQTKDYYDEEAENKIIQKSNILSNLFSRRYFEKFASI